MKTLWIVLVALLLWASALAGELVRSLDWQASVTGGPGVEFAPADGEVDFDRIRVHNPGPEALTASLLVIQDPGVTQAAWALAGQLRTVGVQGGGFLEMWSHLSGGGAYFSRSLADQGPMRSLTGDQDWRAFVLPFQGQADGPRLERLVINVVLPGPGTVEIGPLRLLEGADLPALMSSQTTSGGWFTDAQAGWVGGLGGGAIGLLGLLIGLLVSRGRGRGLVMGIYGLALALGLGLAGVGVYALVQAQPYAVYYPFLLGGVILLLLPALTFQGMRRRYQALELRKIQSMDTP